MRVRVWLAAVFWVSQAAAQSLGGAGTLRGTVRDASGAPAPGAIVEISNAVTGYSVQTVSGADGAYLVGSIPPNTYRVRVFLPGFQVYAVDVRIRSAVPV